MNVREKLVELLEEAKLLARGTIGSMNRGFGGWYADYLVAHGVTVQEWISVSERLPEDEGKFLVCGNRGGIYTAEFRKFGGVYPHWHKLNSKSHYCAPTHWMPLPPTPKEE